MSSLPSSYRGNLLVAIKAIGNFGASSAVCVLPTSFGKKENHMRTAILIIFLFCSLAPKLSATERILLSTQEITQNLHGSEVVFPLRLSAIAPDTGQSIQTVVLDLGLENALPVFAEMIAAELQKTAGECTLRINTNESIVSIVAGALNFSTKLELQARLCLLGRETHLASDNGALTFIVKLHLLKSGEVHFSLEELSLEGFPTISRFTDPEPIIQDQINIFMDELNNTQLLPPVSRISSGGEFAYSQLVLGGGSGLDPELSLFLNREPTQEP